MGGAPLRPSPPRNIPQARSDTRAGEGLLGAPPGVRGKWPHLGCPWPALCPVALTKGAIAGGSSRPTLTLSPPAGDRLAASILNWFNDTAFEPWSPVISAEFGAPRLTHHPHSTQGEPGLRPGQRKFLSWALPWGRERRWDGGVEGHAGVRAYPVQPGSPLPERVEHAPCPSGAWSHPPATFGERCAGWVLWAVPGGEAPLGAQGG